MDHTLADFLRRALIWPDPNDTSGWVNLHWRRQDGKGITGGQAFKTLEDVHNFIRWATSPKGRKYIADMYYCTSLQKEHGDPKQNGHFAALRSADNALASKLLFADVDKYESKDAAEAAIRSFCQRSNSPYPTALVDSGGGLHAYWILPLALPKDVWLDVAAKFDGLMNEHGLKHDNISTDIARILRPPETFNFKKELPRPVVLQLLNGDIDLDAWRSLQAATPTPQRVALLRPFGQKDELYVHPGLKLEGPSPLAQGDKEDIGGTINPSMALLKCPMFSNAIDTGGKDVGQPVWHQQALACTFFAEGRKVFHALGCRHRDYSEESSNAMFDRKVGDRFRLGLGYPTCASFEANGAPQCATCPLKGKITSPLHIEQFVPVDVEAQKLRVILPAEIYPIVDQNDRPALPPDGEFDCDYFYGEDGLVYITEKRGRQKVPVKLLGSKIYSAQLYKEERGDAVGVRLKCTSDGGSPITASVPGVAFGKLNTGIYESLNEQGVIVMGNASKVTEMMCYFRTRMALEQKAMRNVPYGWEFPERKEGQKQSLPVGFAYAGRVYSGDGSRETFGADPMLEETYCVTGMPEPWIDAVKAIQSMKSPGHNAVLLSAFAAPLMILSDHPSTVVMVRGDSGGSKSTASAIACAVWARPRTGIIKPNSSKLGLMRRMGRIRHLPTIWDDIRNSMFDMVKDTLMEITQGGDGLKLDVNRNEREQGIWDNMLLTSSNNSLAEYLEAASKQDGASLVRCFEFEVPKILQGDPAYLDFGILAPLVASLDHNHGHIGREYAKLLGRNPVQLKLEYRHTVERLAHRVAPYQPHERFWMAAVATLTMAAHLVNTIPCMDEAQFDTVALEDFLVNTFLLQRQRLAGADIHAEKSQFAKHWLSMFFVEHAGPRSQIVWTADAPERPGKPEKVSPIFPVGDKARDMKRVTVRFMTMSRKVRVSKKALDDYLRDNEVSVDKVKEGLTKFYGAKLDRKRLAAGLDNISAQGPEQIYEIDVNHGSWLDGIMKQHNGPENGPLPPEQNPDLQELRHPPGHKGQANGKDAS